MFLIRKSEIGKSLVWRSVIFISLAVMVILSALTLFNWHHQRKILIEMGNASLAEYANLTWLSISHLMLMGDQEGIAEQFADYKKNLKTLQTVYLTDSSGVIRRSSDGRLVGLGNVSVHIQEVLRGKDYQGFELDPQTNQLSYVKMIPVRNEKQCYVCMGSEDEVLGVLRVAFDWKHVVAAVKLTRNWNMRLSVLGIVAIIVMMLVFIFRVILNPIRALEAGLKQVAEGNLDVEIKTNRRDEIGSLTRSFNKMSRDLKKLLGVEKHRVELAALNVNLQQEVVERKAVEDKLQDSYSELKRVKLQLFQSAKMASIGILSGGVAHEINNPLTGVLNNVQLIKMLAKEKETFDLNEFREMLDIIEDSANRCVKITRSLLDFSRVPGGVFTLLRLNEIVEAVLVLVKHEFSLGNIKIEKQLAPDLAFIKGERQSLQQVMMDMLFNARWAIKEKSSSDGGTITIKTENNPGERGVNIIFTDTGIGISAENQDKIFEPFFTTKDPGEGAGLGLAIIYNIIKEHNGRIEVSSERNQGATFKIFFPSAEF